MEGNTPSTILKHLDYFKYFITAMEVMILYDRYCFLHLLTERRTTTPSYGRTMDDLGAGLLWTLSTLQCHIFVSPMPLYNGISTRLDRASAFRSIYTARRIDTYLIVYHSTVRWLVLLLLYTLNKKTSNYS